jgi:hypothetical protein
MRGGRQCRTINKKMKVFPKTSHNVNRTLFVIIASNAPENESDLNAQLNTWLSNLPKNYSFLILRGSNNNDYYLDGYTLFLPITEKYENILAKTALGIRWACKNLEFDILIRTNVSTYFPIEHVDRLVGSIDSDAPYFGGYIERCATPNTANGHVIPFVAGTALVLSRESAYDLAQIPFENYIGIPDDVAMSIYAKEIHMKAKPLKRNNLSQNHIFLPTFQIRLKTSKDSSLASRRMKDVHKYFETSNIHFRFLNYFRITLTEIMYIDFHPNMIFDFLRRLAISARYRLLKERLWGEM